MSRRICPNKLQFPHIYMVEASAGSGKTYALAKRYIQLLSLGPQEAALNTILAITFTNKSAIEMKQRILEFLKRIALDKFHTPEEKKDILSCLAVNQESASPKAHKIMDELIRNYNFFQIQTIDSFINSILSACAFKLNLSANFKTEKNYKDYLAYGLDRLIDRVNEDNGVRMIFEGFIKQYLHLDNRSGWFPKQHIFSVVSDLFAKSNKHRRPFIRNDISPADIIALKKQIIGLMRQLQINLPQGAMLNFANSLNNFLLQNKEGFNLDTLSEFFKREDFPVKKGWEAGRTASRFWEDIRESILRLCMLESASIFNYYIDIFNGVMFELKEICAKEDVLFLEALNKQADALLTELGLPELYCRMATVFRHFLIDEFQDTSHLQWNNLLIMIEEALSTRGSLFYVGDRKQAIYRFRGGEVSLIDSVKWHFARLKPVEEILTKNYRSQKEIVEFNNMVFSADNLRRFLNEKEINLELEPPDTEEIIKVFEGSGQSYRSEKSAGYVQLEFTDYNERDIILKEKLIQLIREIKTRFSLDDTALLVRTNDEIELLTSWLLEHGIPVASEKTLNIRENPRIKEIISLLKFLNSPVDNLSFASFILGDIFLKAACLSREEIQEFIFEFNQGRKDNEILPPPGRGQSLPLTRRGRGDREGNGLQGGRAALSHSEPRHFVGAQNDAKLRVSQQRLYLYREFRLKFPRVWDDLIEELFKNVGFVPLYELAVTIYSRFKVMNNFNAEQGFFMKLLELIKENEEDKFSLFSFLDFFENADKDYLYVHSSRDNAVKIRTIHKAKGLEFPVVIIPFLELNIKPGRTVIKQEKEQLKLLYLKKEYADYCPDLGYEYKQQCLNSLVDELNSIYVALTRAIDELYIFVPVKPRKNLNLAKFLFTPTPAFEAQSQKLVWGCSENNTSALNSLSLRGNPDIFSRGDRSNLTQSVILTPHWRGKNLNGIASPSARNDAYCGGIINIPPSQYKDWITLLKDEFIDRHILKARESIRKGEVLHSILSFIADIHHQDIAELVKQAVEKTRPRFPELIDFSETTQIITNLLNEKNLRDYFDLERGGVYLEKEIVDAYGNAKRIDRLLVTEKEVIVVDYKSSRLDQEDYHKQVREYMRLVGDVYPGLKVRGVLVYLDDLKCEEVQWTG